jgi:rSAM/selenodomain-associated transferase 2/rSAM/selenodomain-associated transferase 1
VIVVDGGSTDDTFTLVLPLADRVLVGTRGRAAQMNAGAAVANGDVFLFLHADCLLPTAGIDAIAREMPRSGRRWGRFDVAIDAGSWLLNVVSRSMNLRSRATGIATGDQGIFVERALFAEIGGFALQPLMEDITLSARLKGVGGRPLCLRQQIVTSGRRWEANGAWRTIWTMWRLRFDYWRGVDCAILAERYAKLRSRLQPSPQAVEPSRRAADATESRQRTAEPFRSPHPTLPTLQVFAKAPVAGTVKTRLVPAIGDVEAAALHEQLVQRTLATAVAARAAGIVAAVELWCANAPDHHSFAQWRDRFAITLASQDGDDLGSRMSHALGTSLARGAPAILIGTDCPVLDVNYLARAAAALHDNDAVFGPAEDGGYVLVGLARPVDAFTDIMWGGSNVMSATRTKLRANKVMWHELPALWDIDTPDDLERWRALDIASRRAMAKNRGARAEAVGTAVGTRRLQNAQIHRLP